MLQRAQFTNCALFLLLSIFGGNVKIEKLKEYKVSEYSVYSDVDKKHVANYQQLIKFFENAISQSINGGETNYKSLHQSCLQSIRFLDNLIFTYDSSVQSVRFLNSTIDKIISENSASKEEREDAEGNESGYVSPL